MISANELIALTSSYYPAIGDPKLQTPDEWRCRFDNAAETKALRRRQECAAQKYHEWLGFLTDAQKALPAYQIRNESHVELDASYAAQIVAPPHARHNQLLMVYVSFIAPVYMSYELHDVLTDSDQSKTLVRSEESSQEMQDAASYIERDVPQRFSVERIPPDIAQLVVPNIAMENLGPGEVTLADALFSEQRW